MTLTRALALAWLAAVPASGHAADEFDELKHSFDYDVQQPLDCRQQLLQERGGVRLFDLSYASPKGGRVTAFLVAPGGQGPFAGIVFGHWGPGNRTEFLAEARRYARSGAVSLLVDFPWARPGPWRKRFKETEDPESDHALVVQAVLDLRRGLDLLVAHRDVDPKRLAYVGHSFGAQCGAILSAVDPRLRGVVLMAGIPDQEAIYRDGSDPAAVELRAIVPKEKMDSYLLSCRRTAPVRYVRNAAVPLLFQFAQYDRFLDRAAMDRYVAAAPEPRDVQWYVTGHELNDPEALQYRTDWLHRRVGASPPERPARD
jgi:dienelactone hydrolase